MFLLCQNDTVPDIKLIQVMVENFKKTVSRFKRKSPKGEKIPSDMTLVLFVNF